MKTEIKTEKKFDAVKFMRQQRDRVSQIIKGMTPEQELEYFRKKSEEFRNSKWTAQPTTFSQIDENPREKPPEVPTLFRGFSFYLMLTEAPGTGTLLGEKVRLLLSSPGLMSKSI